MKGIRNNERETTKGKYIKEIEQMRKTKKVEQRKERREND